MLNPYKYVKTLGEVKEEFDKIEEEHRTIATRYTGLKYLFKSYPVMLRFKMLRRQRKKLIGAMR